MMKGLLFHSQWRVLYFCYIWLHFSGDALHDSLFSSFPVKITVFYIFFFAGLAAFFGLMLYIFLLTLNPNHPKWIGEDGLIGKNPGIGFRPMPDQEKNVESTLIWFDRNKEKKDPFWSKELDDFFDKSECWGPVPVLWVTHTQI